MDALPQRPAPQATIDTSPKRVPTTQPPIQPQMPPTEQRGRSLSFSSIDEEALAPNRPPKHPQSVPAESADKRRGTFPNLTGTTCYLASTLQAVLHADPLRRMAADHVTAPNCGPDCAWCLLRSAEKRTRHPSEKAELLEWQAFFEDCVPDWSFQRQQHDAAEALRLILMDAGKRSTSQGACLADSLFDLCGVQLRESICSTYRCGHCLQETRSQIVPEQLLEIAPPDDGQPVEVQRLLREPLTCEDVACDRALCAECGQAPRNQKTLILEKASELLLVSVNREKVTRREFVGGRGRSKSTTRSKYASKKVTTPLIPTRRVEVGDAMYALLAVVAHEGASANRGHYRCFVHLGENEGFRDYNDGVAKDIGAQLPGTAYTGSRILVYHRLALDNAAPCPEAPAPPMSTTAPAPAAAAAVEPEEADQPDAEPQLEESQLPPTALDEADSDDPGSDGEYKGEADMSDGYLSATEDPEGDLQRDCEKLLEAFASGGEGSARKFLATLPLVHDSVVNLGPQALLQRLRLHGELLTSNRIDGPAAVSASTPLWGCTLYPLAVLVVAMSKSATMPGPFYLDSILASISGILNKNIGVQVAGFMSRSKYWVADTAEPGSGKSPAVDPIMGALCEVFDEEPSWAPGTRTNRYHLQEGTTHAVAADRLQEADGYLCVATGEAGPLLCPQWPSSMTWNQTTHLNLQRFLDAANGGRFQWEKMADRTAGKKKDAADKECTGISFQRTGVVFALFQQLSVLAKWWALAESKQSIGLPARFLFGFGTSKPPGPVKTSMFIHDFALPLVKKMFRAVLRRLGPKSPLGTNEEDTVERWSFSVSGERVIRTVRHITHLLGKRPGVGSCLNSGFAKTPYIAGNYALLMSILRQLWPNVVQNVALESIKFTTLMDFDALKLSIEFYRMRYLHGLAVLDTEIRRHAWVDKEKKTEDLKSLDYHATLLLRTGIGHVLTPGDVVNINEMYAHAESKRRHERERALHRMTQLFDHMRLRGLGRILDAKTEGNATSTPVFQKRCYAMLARPTQDWLLQQKVPAWSFEAHVGIRAAHAPAEMLLPLTAASLPAPMTPSSALMNLGTSLLPAQSPATPMRPAPASARLHDAPAIEDDQAESGSLPVDFSSLPTRKPRAQPKAMLRIHVDGPILKRPDVVARVVQECEKEGHNVFVKLKESRPTCWKYVGHCLASDTCTRRWSAFYHFKTGSQTARTLLLQTFGEHSHADGQKDTAAIWRPAALKVAEKYVRETAMPTSAGLLAALNADLTESDRAGLPTNAQRRSWLARALSHKRSQQGDTRRGARQSGQASDSQPSQGQRSKVPVEECRAHLRRLPTEPSLVRSQLFLVSPPVVTEDRVYVPLSCPRLIKRMRRYTGQRFHISVDRKMKCLQRGWGIATASVLVRSNRPRNTNLGRRFGKRLQGKAFTLRAKPLLHAIMDEETTENFAALFRDLDGLWEAHGRGEGRLAERVFQVHKDFAPGIEKARQQIFPRSRPCNDFFHLAQKHKALEKICREAGVSDDRVGIVNAFLHDQRSAPTLDIVSAITRAMFERVRQEFGAPTLVAHLSTHVQEISRTAAEGMHLDPRPEGHDRLLFPTYWTGVFGIYPDTQSGNEAGEAIHSAWEADVQAKASRPGMDEAIRTLAAVHEGLEDNGEETDEEEELGLAHTTEDPALINGRSLHAAGRSTARDYHEHRLLPNHVVLQVTPDIVVVAFAASAEDKVNVPAAHMGARMLFLGGHALDEALAAAGITQMTVTGSAVLSLSTYHEYFSSIAYVIIHRSGVAHASGYAGMLCTCQPFGLHGRCEHVYFAQSLPFPMRSLELHGPVRNFADAPMHAERGRKRGVLLTPSGKRKAARKAAAAATKLEPHSAKEEKHATAPPAATGSRKTKKKVGLAATQLDPASASDGEPKIEPTQLDPPTAEERLPSRHLTCSLLFRPPGAPQVTPQNLRGELKPAMPVWLGPAALSRPRRARLALAPPGLAHPNTAWLAQPSPAPPSPSWPGVARPVSTRPALGGPACHAPYRAGRAPGHSGLIK